MARCLQIWGFHSQLPLLSSKLFASPPSILGSTKIKFLSVACCKNNQQQIPTTWTIDREITDQPQAGRREVLFHTAFSAFSFPAFLSIGLADENVSEDFRIYTDDVNKFKITIPGDWQVGEGEGNGIKSVTAFYPVEASSTSNVSIVITGVGPDFTRLESFGKVDAFAESLVNGLDRSWKRPPGVAAKLIDCSAANGLYYIEYSLQNPGDSRRRLYTVLGMANNGWYNRLYTVTGQFVDEEEEKYGSMIKKAIASFRFT